MAEIAFDLEIDGKVKAECVLITETATKFITHRGIAHIRDMTDHARDGQATSGRPCVVVVALVPIGISHDRLTPDLIERNLLCAVARCRGDRDSSSNRFGESDGPF